MEKLRIAGVITGIVVMLAGAGTSDAGGSLVIAIPLGIAGVALMYFSAMPWLDSWMPRNRHSEVDKYR